MVNRREFTSLMAIGAGVPLAAAAKKGPSSGRTRFDKLRSSNVPGEVGVSIYLPPGYEQAPANPHPLLLLLHGGNGSERDLLRFTPAIDDAIANGRIPPAVVAMPGARRSLYMDYRDGSERWESFIISELLPYLRKSLNVSTARRDTVIGGWSMGGLGSLRLAFKHPDFFAAVAALEPAIEPVLSWNEIGPYVKFWRSDAVYEEIFGSPVDLDYWAKNNPATIAHKDPMRLLDLGIFMDVGDQDMLYLDKGVEFLHRLLFDAGVGHEYRLVQGGEHVGPSLAPRFDEALAFLGRQLERPEWIDAEVRKYRAIMDDKKRAVGLPVEDVDPRRIRGMGCPTPNCADKR